MVAPTFFPIEGGTETMVRSFSNELNKRGIHADVMTFNMVKRWNVKWSGKAENIDGFTVYKVPALNWLPIKHSPRITQNLNLIPGRFTHIMKDYDIIHFHEVDFSFPLFSYFVKKPKILHLHGISFDYFKRYHLSRFLLNNAANVYISLTNQMKKELTTLGIPKDNIEILPNAVNTKVFNPKGKKMDNTILYVGRIEPNKGLHVLLNSLKHLKSSVTLEIIGPLDWNADYCQKIMNLIESENKRGIHKVEYLGHVDRATLIAKYQEASIFVSSSSFEPFGVVLLEAMACETPVVSTRTQGPVEIIDDGKTGMLVPVNDPVKLAEAFEYLLENEDMRKKLGKQGRELIDSSYSIEAVVQKLCKVYGKIDTRTNY